MQMSTRGGLDYNSNITVIWFLSSLSAKFSDVSRSHHPHAFRMVSWHEVCSDYSLLTNVGSQHFPWHSLASHEVTRIHTCNPAALENTVASEVVHKLQPHCKHVIHYALCVGGGFKWDNDKISFGSCQDGRKNTPLLEGVACAQSSCAGAHPAMCASIRLQSCRVLLFSLHME